MCSGDWLSMRCGQWITAVLVLIAWGVEVCDVTKKKKFSCDPQIWQGTDPIVKWRSVIPRELPVLALSSSERRANQDLWEGWWEVWFWCTSTLLEGRGNNQDLARFSPSMVPVKNYLVTYYYYFVTYHLLCYSYAGDGHTCPLTWLIILLTILLHYVDFKNGNVFRPNVTAGSNAKLIFMTSRFVGANFLHYGPFSQRDAKDFASTWVMSP